MIGLRRALLGLGAVGLACGGLAAAIVLSSDSVSRPVQTAAIGLWVGLSFIGTGLYAWWRRPHNRFGMLMTVVGFAWFLGALGDANTPVIANIGALLGSLSFAVLIQMLLAFPTGRLENRFQRGVVVFVYVVCTIGTAPLILLSPDYCDCAQQPPNDLLIADLPTVVSIVEAVVTLLAVGLLVAIAVILVRRWRSVAIASRQAMAPVLLVGTVTLALLVLQLVVQLASVSDGLSEGIHLVSLAAFGLLPYAFLVGLLRSRYSRVGAVSELIAGLGEAPTSVDVHRALSEALGDPSLELVYWFAESGAYVDAAGAPVTLPAGGGDRACTEIERDGRPVAAIVHDASLAEDPELVRAAGAAASLALDNERLEAALRARVAELRSSRARLVQAGDSERRRLERDLHDGAQQRLVALSMALGLARNRITSDPAEARRLIDGAQVELQQAMGELRELARGIHPAVLVDRGLDGALGVLAGRAPLDVDLRSTPAERLPVPVEVAAYYVVAEALTNVARYAEAEHATIAVDRRNGTAVIEVTDDGVGGADPAAGSGLRGLADRVAALDGRLDIVSPPGEGTIVRAEIPCAS